MRRAFLSALGASQPSMGVASATLPAASSLLQRRAVAVGPHSGLDNNAGGAAATAGHSATSASSPKDATANASALFENTSFADFGSVKRREQRRKERMLRNKAATEAIEFMERIVSRPTPTAELEAQSTLRDMGFIQKPPSCVYYRQFLSELRRYKVDIGLLPTGNAVQLFSLTDYGIDGKGESEVKLCDEMRCYDATEENLASDLHGAVSTLLFSKKPMTHTVRIANEFNIAYDLVFESVLPLSVGNPDGAPSSSSSTATMSPDELAHIEQERLLNEALKKPFEAVPGGPYRRYIQRVNAVIDNKQSGARKDLFSNMSIQCFVYMFIMAVSRFMRVAKAANNNPFDVDSVKYLRYSIVGLRQQIGMEPIGDFELDHLLPKFDDE